MTKCNIQADYRDIDRDMKKSTFLTILIPVIMVCFMISIPVIIINADDSVIDMLPIVMPVAFILLFGILGVLSYYLTKSQTGDVIVMKSPGKQTVETQNRETLCPHCGEFIGYGDRDYCPSCGKKIDDKML